MREQDLAAVMAVESTIYSHPWTRGNFADSLRAGYECFVLRSGPQLLGYFVLMVAAGEAMAGNGTASHPPRAST